MAENKKYFQVESCDEVVFNEETGFYKLEPCSFEDTRRAYLQTKSDGLVVGENRLQLSNGNQHPKEIIMVVSRTSDKSRSADDIYKIKKNSGGNRKKKTLPSAESGNVMNMITTVPA